MPLSHGKSHKAFVKNLKTEMEHGKPQKQALAIAYSMQRRKKHAYGGPTGNGVYADGFEGYDEGGQVANPNSPSSMGVPSGVLSAMNMTKKAEGGKVCEHCGYAEGGEVKQRAMHAFHGGDESLDSGLEQHVSEAKHEHEEGATGYDHASPGNYQEDEHFKEEPETHPAEEQRSGFVSHEGNDVKHDEPAAHEDARRLNQHGKEEEGPEDHMAEGGFITDNEQDESHEMDMVGRVMAQKQRRFSEGGKVANDTEDHELKYETPNEFDDLVLRDDLESTYGDDNNAGDEDDSEGENERRSDIVSKIMASRKKKDKLPRPA